jgi:hypothetical protein
LKILVANFLWVQQWIGIFQRTVDLLQKDRELKLSAGNIEGKKKILSACGTHRIGEKLYRVLVEKPKG